MPNVSGVTSYFTRAVENTVPMTLGGSVLAGAATVAVNGMTNYTDGDVVCFVVDPGTPALKQAFTGTKNGSNIINVVWTEFPTGGVNVPHASGATVVDYVTSSDWDMLTTGVGKSLNQDGSLKSAAVQTALNITGGAAGGWTPTGFAPSAVVPNGNRSYNLTFAAQDLTPTLTPGMRLQMIRTVAAPTQCTSLDGTTQFFSKASPNKLTFTDDFVVSAWIKVSSYANGAIVSRYNGTSGWSFELTSLGQIALNGWNGGSSNVSQIIAYQSVPLNKWVHVAAQLDMSAFTATTTTSYTMMDGVDVPAGVGRGGTNPTALIQAGNLEVGSRNAGTTFFPGKIAQVAIYSAKVTQATIAASINQTLAGTETSLASAYSFSNSMSDLNTTTPNNLSANNAAAATNTDTPFTQTQSLTGFVNGTTNYGIVQAASFSTNTTVTVQVPEGDTIPTSGGVSAVSYATQKAPYGFPSQRGKWLVQCIHRTDDTVATPTVSTFYNMGSTYINVPIGEWIGRYDVHIYNEGPTTTSGSNVALSTSSSAISDFDMSTEGYLGTGQATIYTGIRQRSYSLTVATIYYLIASKTNGSLAFLHFYGSLHDTVITFENAYL